jgi:gas vesicle protein
MSDVKELFPNCDAWGAVEWYKRMVDSVARYDEAMRSGNDIQAATFKNIISSSAFRLARDFPAALSGTREAVEPVALIQPEVLAALAKDKTATGTVSSPLLRDPFGNPVALYTAPPSDPVGHGAVTVDGLAAEIRRVDGNHSLGAGALAEALMPFILAALSPAPEAGSDEVERLTRGLNDEIQFMRKAAKENRERAEAAEAEITALREKLGEMRECQAKMHRRAQTAEAYTQSVRDIVKTWNEVARNADHRVKNVLFDAALQDIAKAEARRTARATLANTDKEAGR